MGPGGQINSEWVKIDLIHAFESALSDEFLPAFDSVYNSMIDGVDDADRC